MLSSKKRHLLMHIHLKVVTRSSAATMKGQRFRAFKMHLKVQLSFKLSPRL